MKKKKMRALIEKHERAIGELTFELGIIEWWVNEAAVSDADKLRALKVLLKDLLREYQE